MACSNVSVSTIGSCTIFSDQTHWLVGFHLSLVMSPCVTSYTSSSSSCLRCLFQTCRPG